MNPKSPAQNGLLTLDAKATHPGLRSMQARARIGALADPTGRPLFCMRRRLS
jgi:hypothetical protein